MERKIIWNQTPSKAFVNELIRISEASIKNAEIVESAILTAIEGILDHPERYPADKYKINNTGDYRAFETHSFRVAYRITEKEIRILRIRHVRQEPKTY